MTHVSFNETKIKYLTLAETPVINSEMIINLQSSLGRKNSRDIVERATLEITDRLNRVHPSLKHGDIKTARKLASCLIAMSEQIGLVKLAQIAQDLINGIDNQDFVAIAAIANRLLRQGESAVIAALEFPDCSANP